MLKVSTRNRMHGEITEIAYESSKLAEVSQLYGRWQNVEFSYFFFQFSRI